MNQNTNASEPDSKTKARDLWVKNTHSQYQLNVTITPLEGTNETGKKIILMEDLEKRKEVYGICGECNEPGTGRRWCQPCNTRRFKENFKNWTSGNKDLDELIQHSQINALHRKGVLEWIPYEKFKNITYITRGGFGKIYSADWPEGSIRFWDIENQKWDKCPNVKVALKCLDNSSNLSREFLNEDPITKDYMMVLLYCTNGNLRDHLINGSISLNCNKKIEHLTEIASGLLNIHSAGRVHKDFHSGNILYGSFGHPHISDLGMCQPANIDNESNNEGSYGVLPYMAPEVLRGHPYEKASDIYSFGIVMNELMSEEIPYSNEPHDHTLAIKVCKGYRPKISEDTPKLIADLINKCWDTNPENRPTGKELYQTLKKWKIEMYDNNSEIKSQIKKCKRNKLKNKPTRSQSHPQAIYTSRHINFKNILDPINSTNSSSHSDDTPSSSSNLISECFDCQLSELDLNQEDE
ncbi:kinase-like domain-containing protein [Rhizophagus clarus]|uniref:Kinase-like domain-containing protein n=1 Tax=Rhizophagus clarus TaxID=94130 RepID=A0A8H3LRE2_9GLOM|nr:kinase-like domain-containing protein [Rhizophagus clarus]